MADQVCDGKRKKTMMIQEGDAMKLIKSSQFCNTYGGLDLVEDDEGKHFLRMEDCFGPSYWGPLIVEQVRAFYILCAVKEV